MPRRTRLDTAGYHHVINRGVNRSHIFEETQDYEMFLKILCKACTAYRAVVHDYCLMSNHFHLLVETELDNLSLFMKHINSNYAIYFNKKYGRSGHFWQGRFYSRYLTDDAYYYTLIRYIEQNPIAAGLTKEIGKYPYTLGAALLAKNEIIPCAQASKLVAELTYENIEAIIGITINEEDLEILGTIEKQKVLVDEQHAKLAYGKSLKEHFKEAVTKTERNKAIFNALNDGYTQAAVSKWLGVSRSLISKVVKSGDSTPDP